MSEHRLAKHRITRLVFQLSAVLCIALGVLGIFLPLLPTTPFLLLAVWFSLRSSPRIYRWLIHHPTLGPSLRRYLNDRSISPTLCRRALLILWISIAFSMLLVKPLLLKIMLFCIASGVTLYLLKLASRYKKSNMITDKQA